MKPEDAPKKANKAKTTAQDSEGGAVSSHALSAKLIESLSAHRSAALTAELMDRPEIALAAVVHAMAMPVFCGSSRSKTCLQVSLVEHSQRRVEGAPAFEAIERAKANWGDQIPGSPDDLWTWCLQQDRDTLIDQLAFAPPRPSMP